MGYTKSDQKISKIRNLYPTTTYNKVVYGNGREQDKWFLEWFNLHFLPAVPFPAVDCSIPRTGCSSQGPWCNPGSLLQLLCSASSQGESSSNSSSSGEGVCKQTSITSLSLHLPLPLICDKCSSVCAAIPQCLDAISTQRLRTNYEII